APVYSAADKAGVVPELRGLLASRATPEVLAIVLSRRLGRQVLVEPPDHDVPLPLLRWSAGEDQPGRANERPVAKRLQDELLDRLRSARIQGLNRWAVPATASGDVTGGGNGDQGEGGDGKDGNEKR
ncbi:MAG: hypothetical protein OEW30_22025, partial [Acidimicrobiia bacterium]|nr:hypothetical protein [Acidimicrobiia bacterium]